MTLPSPRMAVRVWQRNRRVFGKAWRGALLPQFLDPVFYLVALGFGLGAYLSTVRGIPYREWVAPGLCASAVMWAASFETTWNVYFRMSETRLYDAILSTPVEVEDLVAGEALWGATRAVVYGTVFLGVVAVVGLVSSPWAVLLPLFLLLGGLCFAVMGLTFTALTPSADHYSYYYTLLITPMFLFGGIFFPYDRLPEWAQIVAWCTPLYHVVEIARALATGPDALGVAADALWLLAFTGALALVLLRAMRRRLVA